MFESLDFIYTPSHDVAADATYYSEILGGTVVFKIEENRTRVAMIELTESPPRILLADHLEGDHPVLLYRVDDLEAALRELEARGWKRERTFEIPQGRCCSFRTTGGQRIGLYELTRPEVEAHFTGRSDF